MSRLALEKHCWAEIDLTALRSNFEYIHRAVGGDICADAKHFTTNDDGEN